MLHDQAKGIHQVCNYTITTRKFQQGFVIRFSLGGQETIIYIRENGSIYVEGLGLLFKEVKKQCNIERAERIGERAEPCPTPASMSQALERKEFQEYWVDLPTR